MTGKKIVNNKSDELKALYIHYLVKRSVVIKNTSFRLEDVMVKLRIK